MAKVLSGLAWMLAAGVFAPSVATAQGAVARIERYTIGQINCRAADVDVEAVTSTLVGQTGTPERVVTVILTEDAGARIARQVPLALSDAQLLQQQLATLFDAEVAPRPPRAAATYVGAGLPPVAAPFVEFTARFKGLVVGTHDTIAGRRFFVTSDTAAPITADCDAPAAVAQLKTLVDTAIGVLKR